MHLSFASINMIPRHDECCTFVGLAAADVKTGQATRVPLTPHTPGHGEGAGDEEEGSGNGLPVTTPAKAVLEFDAASDSTASELLSMQAASESAARELPSMQAAPDSTPSELPSMQAASNSTASELLSMQAASDSTASELPSIQAASDSTASELLSIQAAVMCQPCLHAWAHTPTALHDCVTTTCCKCFCPGLHCWQSQTVSDMSQTVSDMRQRRGLEDVLLLQGR